MIKKKIILGIIVCSFFLGNPHYGHSSNEDFLGKSKVQENLKGSSEELVPTVESWVKYLLNFLYFVAVIYGLWGGFQILIAKDDDEKVKKGKTVIIQGVTGIIVIFLAGYIAGFFLGGVQDGKKVNGLLTDGKIEAGGSGQKNP